MQVIGVGVKEVIDFIVVGFQCGLNIFGDFLDMFMEYGLQFEKFKIGVD